MNRLRRAALALGCLLGTTVLAWAGPSPAWKGLGGMGLRAGAPVELPAPWSLEAGWGRLAMARGQVTPLLLGDRVLGYHFQGQGSFTYESRDPEEWATLRVTLEQNRGPKPTPMGTGISLTLPVQEACLWLEALPGPPLAAPATPDDATLARAEAFVREFRRRGGLDLEAELLTHPRNAPGRPWALLELRGKEGDWIHSFDPAQEEEESLWLLKADGVTPLLGEGKVFVTLAPVSSHPLGRTRTELPRRDLLLQHVDLDLEAQPNGHLRAAVQERLRIENPALRVLDLELQGFWYAAPNATGTLVSHPYRVKSVQDGEGRDLPFRQGDATLQITLPEVLPAGTTMTLRFELEGDILIQPRSDTYWTLGQGWFPQPRHHERAYTVKARLRSPKLFRPLLPGTQVSVKEEAAGWVAEARIDRPVQYYTILAGRYTVLEETRNGQTVRVASYGMDGANAKLVKDLTFDVIKFYEGFLGPFPFREYLVAQVPSLGFGIAPPGLQMITSEAFQPFDGTLNQIFTQGINHRIAHEVAHQYWPHVVQIPSYEEAWLSEAFAEYSSALFIRATRGEGKFRQMAAAWRSEAALAAPMAPLGLANRLRSWDVDPVNGSRFRDRLVYEKGAVVLQALHQELGDLPFLKYLRALQLNFNGKTVTVDHLQGLLDAMTRKDHTPFFRAFVRGTALPPQ